MSAAGIWLTVIVIGALTFALRFSFLALFGRGELPGLLERLLVPLPAAVLAALVVPALFYTGGSLDLSLSNERLVAGGLAAVVAWRTHSVLLTIGTGMGILLLLQVVF
ncbi:MAG: AzlD domain-containing protein [Rubrobacter sp.]|nr:AzlD domain-containing protein [Rubrobacter sp.]